MTKLLYDKEMQLLDCTACVVDVIPDEADPQRFKVILDQTIFYPQGGGQPYDQGTIQNASSSFNVGEVRFSDGTVYHIGTFTGNPFSAGDTVKCLVDGERRSLHSRLHSAGHLLDMAMNSVQLPWIPTKAYHFPQGPYVEYEGSLGGVNVDALKKDLESACENYINQQIPTTILFVPKDQLTQYCSSVPDYIPVDKPTRVVLYGKFGVPCGGTHVKNTSEIGTITIRKLKEKKGQIRISYDISE
ncbi:hypothetical protein JW872_01670 [Candidatus Babeliales bacterium]|nr:hypothetical protein [Candidatus Babeliales bacterium]